MKKNGLITFCCALIPGCGQMYQGYMKRGVSLLAWFFGVIALAASFYLEALLFLLPIIWAYSFFDTFNLRNMPDAQRAVMQDYFIPSLPWLDDTGIEKLTKNLKMTKVAGWVCIGLGALTLYGVFWNSLYNLVWSYVPALAAWLDRLPALVVAVAVIALGLWLLRGGKAPKEQEETEEIPEFKGENNDA